MSLRLATGAAAFAGDVLPPNLLHVALRRSPVPHARVRRVDASAARQLPGVAAVLAHRDAPSVLGEVARFVGDRVAAVAAEDPETARRAAELVELELESLPAHPDAWGDQPDEAALAGRLTVSEGDVERALDAAEVVVEGEWELPFAPGISLEPALAVTWLDEDRRLVVRTSAESPFRVRAALAELLDLEAARIRVLRPAGAGGALGRSDLAVEDVCALVTLRTGRPARLALTAAEALAVAPGRPAQRVGLRVGLARGELCALDATLVVDAGAVAGDLSELLRSSTRQALGLYRLPSLRVRARAVRTHRPPACAPRGSDSGFAVALECALDEAAVRLGVDPVALRRGLLRRPGDPGASALAALGEPPGGDDARQLAELLRALRPAGPDDNVVAAAGPLRHGRGAAVARRADSVGQAGAATLRLLDDGSFTLAAGPAATGSADERLYADAAAAILGVPPRKVVCAAPDTDSAPYLTAGDAPGSSAAGRAVEQAATLVRDRILAAGARLLGVSVERVALADGRVSEPSGRVASFAEIGRAALRAGDPIDATARPDEAPIRHSLAAALAEVEADVETGQVRVRRLQAVVAAGPFEDARPAAAQVEGALAQACEQALVGLQASDGAPVPPLVAPADVPPLVVAFVPTGDPLSRFGTAAHAEAASRAALAALANAIARAAGVRPRTLPLDPGRLLSAIPAPEPGR